MGAIAYRACLEHEIVKPDFDPFEIFGIKQEDYQDFEASKKPIKSINRKLSKDKHPDRLRQKWLQENPDAEGVPPELEEEWNADWTLIVRAYKTLTDEVRIKEFMFFIFYPYAVGIRNFKSRNLNYSNFASF